MKTWLSPVQEAHEAKYGKGTFAPEMGRADSGLRELWKAGHEPQAIGEHYAVYLAGLEDSRFHSFPMFAKLYASFTPRPKRPLVDEFGILNGPT